MVSAPRSGALPFLFLGVPFALGIEPRCLTGAKRASGTLLKAGTPSGREGQADRQPSPVGDGLAGINGLLALLRNHREGNHVQPFRFWNIESFHLNLMGSVPF